MASASGFDHLALQEMCGSAEIPRVESAGAFDAEADAHARVREAYRRYHAAYSGTRPGTPAAVELVHARMDLTLLLEAEGEALPPELLAQLGRDADTVLRLAVPLREARATEGRSSA